MTSHDAPSGTFPLVFESGVLNLDEEGILHIHLSHKSDAPHPMLTHPEGEETTIPSTLSEVHLLGTGCETVTLRCGLNEVDTLPTGFVFHIKGWKLVQLEMSGDLTVVMEDMEKIPTWFQYGKIHRFDGPEEGVRLYTGSRPLTASGQTKTVFVQPREFGSQPRATRKPQSPTSETPNSNMKKNSSAGCGMLLVLFVLAVGCSLSVIPMLT